MAEKTKAPKPSTVALPACCDRPSHSVNDTTKKADCSHCKSTFTFDGKTWVKDGAAK